MAAVATSASGELLGFAIGEAYGRGKVFVYELHVAEASRKHGIGSALLDLVVRACRPRRASDVTVDLQVHRANEDAMAWYTHKGFVKTMEVSGGGVWEMRMRR